MSLPLRTSLRRSSVAAALLAVVLIPLAARAEADPEAVAAARARMRDVPHPFMMWTREEATELRRRIESDPMAQEQHARMKARDGVGRGGHPTLLNLFNYLVMGDEEAGERELAQLRRFAGSVPEPLTEAFQREAAGRRWARGGASFSDRHMRDEQTLNVLRYDALYDRLTPEEREAVEGSFRAYIQFHLDGHKPWHPDFRYDRMSWLPNMHWPRTIGTHLMAVVLKDPEAIDGMFRSEGGFKWFFDAYLSDGRFYNEEFGKFGPNLGSKLMWCEALERLNLGEYGWGYTGAGGATMLRHLSMLFDIGLPRTVIPGGLDNYPRVHMGDTPGRDLDQPRLGLQSIVTGYLRDGATGGNSRWTQARMLGPLPKLGTPMWMEVGHRRFPDKGFGYFLAAMREPGDEAYIPSLYFGLEPVRPGDVAPPPAPSYLARERGFALLRADESPGYWSGPGPAVALQFGMYYVHYAHDCMAILNYHAFNRPIYTHGWGGRGGTINASINSHRRGYTGGHPWHDTVRGYAGVVVDNLKAMPIASGNQGLEHHMLREQFTDPVRFVAARVAPTEVTDTRWVLNEETDETEVIEVTSVRGIYPGVDLERAVFLTDEYLFDLYWLNSEEPRRYDWHVSALGSHVLAEAQGWRPTSELNGSMLYREMGEPQPEGFGDRYDGNDLRDVRRFDPEAADWETVIVQDDQMVGDMEGSIWGREWFDRRVGVRVRMLGEAGTAVFAGRPPVGEGGTLEEAMALYPEVGGASLMVRRTRPETVFAALHEPFEGGPEQGPVAGFARIAGAEHALAARVTGTDASAVNDRILIAWGPGAEERHTLEGDGERFVFTSHGFVRIGAEEVQVTGQVHELRIRVEGEPRLMVNGEATPARIEDGVLAY